MATSSTSSLDFIQRITPEGSPQWFASTGWSKLQQPRSSVPDIFKNSEEHDVPVVESDDPFYGPKAAFALSVLRGTYFESTNSLQVMDYKKWARQQGVTPQAEGFVVLSEEGKALSLMLCDFAQKNRVQEIEQNAGSKSHKVQQYNASFAAFEQFDKEKLTNKGLLAPNISLTSAIFEPDIFLTKNNQVADWIAKREQRARTTSECLKKYGVHIETKLLSPYEQECAPSKWVEGYPVILRLRKGGIDSVLEDQTASCSIEDLGTIALMNPNALSGIQNARDIASLNAAYSIELFHNILEDLSARFVLFEHLQTHMEKSILEELSQTDGFENLPTYLDEKGHLQEEKLSASQRSYVQRLRFATLRDVQEHSVGGTKMFGYNELQSALVPTQTKTQYLISLDAALVNGQHSVRALSILATALNSPGAVFVDGKVAQGAQSQPINQQYIAKALHSFMKTHYEQSLKNPKGGNALQEAAAAVYKKWYVDAWIQQEQTYLHAQKPPSKEALRTLKKQWEAERQQELLPQFAQYIRSSSHADVRIKPMGSNAVIALERAAHNANKQLTDVEQMLDNFRQSIQNYCNLINDTGAALGFSERLSFTQDIATSGKFSDNIAGVQDLNDLLPIMMVLNKPKNKMHLHTRIGEFIQEQTKKDLWESLPTGKHSKELHAEKNEWTQRLALLASLGSNNKSGGAILSLQKTQLQTFLQEQLEQYAPVASLEQSSAPKTWTSNVIRLVRWHALSFLTQRLTHKGSTPAEHLQALNIAQQSQKNPALSLYAQYQCAVHIDARIRKIEQILQTKKNPGVFNEAKSMRAFILNVLWRSSEEPTGTQEDKKLRSMGNIEAIDVQLDHLERTFKKMHQQNLSVNVIFASWYASREEDARAHPEHQPMWAQKLIADVEHREPGTLLLLEALRLPVWNEHKGCFQMQERNKLKSFTDLCLKHTDSFQPSKGVRLKR